MNIFALANTPQESARLHCDQHLHKMILESAQLVSTALQIRGFLISGIYKSAYSNHPCTQWTAQSNHNIQWVIELAIELNEIRKEVANCYDHGSIKIILRCRDYLNHAFPYVSASAADPRIFVGNIVLAHKRSLSTPEKYQAYYKLKAQAWLDTARPMSYKGRLVPPFMADIIQSGN